MSDALAGVQRWEPVGDGECMPSRFGRFVLASDAEAAVQAAIEATREEQRIFVMAEKHLVREQAIRDCIAAVEAEALHDDTGDPLDMAYMDAINDAIAALRAMLTEGSE